MIKVIDRAHHRARLEILPDVVVKTYHDPAGVEPELSWYVTVGGRFAPPLLESDPRHGRLVIAKGERVTEPAPAELFSLLHSMEAEGISHRDVWPGNLVRVGGELRLIDWETCLYHQGQYGYDLYGPDKSGLPVPDIHAALRRYQMWWDSDHPRSIKSLWGVHVSDME